MALIIDPDDLSQGTETSCAATTFASPSGAQIVITSVNVPAVTASDYIEVRDAADPVNNGIYVVDSTVASTSITATKITGSNPALDAGSATIRIFGDDTLEKSIHFDTDNRVVFIFEKGSVSTDGVTLQALYSFMKEEWKNDADLIKHDFPMVAVTPEQFEFSLNWNPDGTATPTNTTRKLIRTGGWSELDGQGNLIQQYAGVITLGSFDETGDTAYYQQGSDPTDTGARTNFTFSDAVNEAILTFNENVGPDGGTGFVVDATGRLLTRNDGGTNTTDGYVVGANVTIRAAEDTTNNGTFRIAAVAAGADGSLTLGTAADADTGTTYTATTIERFDGGSWIDEGYYVGGTITASSADNAANDVTGTISAVTASIITTDSVWTADTVDTGAVYGPLTANAADTTMITAIDLRDNLKLFLRVGPLPTSNEDDGKIFASSNLTAIGLSTLTNKAERFPLSNAADLKISASDDTIASDAVYDEIRIRYLSTAYNRTVTTALDFGIVIDVGTYSNSNGVSNGSTTFTSVGDMDTGDGEALADYAGGTLTIHDATGPDDTIHTIVGTPTAPGGTLTIVLDSALTNSETGLSFTMQRATPVVASIQQIYEKVQWKLRQSVDADGTGSIVVGDTADELLRFVGDALEAGQAIPDNPNGGGSGVVIEGFDSNDTNSITFFDNSAASESFPFVAAGSINFNNNLVSDSSPSYWMFFDTTKSNAVADLSVTSASGNAATLTGAATLPVVADNDYIRVTGFSDEANNGIWRVSDASPTTSAIDAVKADDGITVVNEGPIAGTIDENPIDSPDAIIVDNNAGTDITGVIGGSSVSFDFDYDGNTQGGRVISTPVSIVLRAIGLDSGQFVETTGTITAATGLTFSLVAALERNYSNP